MIKPKITVSIIVVALMLTTMIAFVSAASYRVYADKWYVMSNGIGVGCEGWTNLTSKNDGTPIYHYSNARAWSGSQYWDSGRKWGTGKVYASTGNVGVGAISSISIYYGTTN
jgi:hypothetical protein